MPIQITLFLSFLFISLSTSACENWFKDLKITNRKTCSSVCRIAKTDMSSYLCPSQCDQLCKTVGKKSINKNDPNFYDLTDDEMALCKSDPVVCASVYLYGQLAEKKCHEIYNVSDHNDESDACRHYMWSFYLLKNFGEKQAKAFLNAHENNPKQNPKEKDMDISNNEISIKDHKQTAKETTPDQALENFKKNLKNKKMKILKPRYSESGGLP